MKRITALLLSLIMVFALCAVSASAAGSKLSQALLDKISSISPDEDLFVAVQFKGYQRKIDEMPSYPDTDKAKEEYKAYLSDREQENIREAFKNIDLDILSEGLGSVVFVQVKAEDVEKIAQSGRVSYLSAYTPYLPENERSHPFGDADCDGELTVLDATVTQKALASLYPLKAYQRFLADADSDDTLSILDATQIQKKLASLIPVLPAEAITDRRFHGIQIDDVSAFLNDFESISRTFFTTESDDIFRIDAFSDEELEYEVSVNNQTVKERSPSPYFRFSYQNDIWGSTDSMTVNVYSPSGAQESVTYDHLRFLGLGAIPDYYLRVYHISFNDVYDDSFTIPQGKSVTVGSWYEVDSTYAEKTIALNYYLDGKLIHTAVMDQEKDEALFDTAFRLDTSDLSEGSHTLKAEGMYGDYPTSYRTAKLNIINEAGFSLSETISVNNITNILKEPIVSGGEAIPYEELYRGVFSHEGLVQSDRNDSVILIDSSEQYEAFLSEHPYEYESLKHEPIPYTLNDSFFENNALIILSYRFDCEVNHLYLKDLYKKGGGLYLNADEQFHHDPDTPYAAYVTSYAVSLNQIKKDEIQDIIKLIVL